MIKIGYFADGPWSHRALQKIVQSPDLDVSFIIPRFDSEDPVLREYANTLQVPFIIHENVNSPDFLEIVAPYSADIFVSMSFNQILKKDIIDRV